MAEPRQHARFTAIVTAEGGGYVSQCVEVDVASQGDTVEEALANLREALELYFEDDVERVLSPPVPLITSIDVELPGR